MLPLWFVENSNADEFWTEERCYITELMNTPASPETSLAIARVEAGVTTQLHHLDGICERYVIRKGSGIIEIDGERQTMQAGDQAIIQPGAAQRITNTGPGELEFYCLCTPRFRPETYVNLEE
ncbi:cupin domain-containing protein [Nitratireductor sp. GISD-1A_MAKvit]|uniref:cupin domain-containing protein n=1 Tax=Nitratireductor sp. GISD-1A_MAKvit TaxID=3234198 RepID=UPI003467C134